MRKPTISSLLKESAGLMRRQFEGIRETIPHGGTKGVAVERVLRKFLNDQMPKRFKSTQGFIIDSNNSLSPQTDVIVYDAFSGVVYRASEDADIVPADAVAAVVEVKSVLKKDALRDAYKKLSACKQLRKAPGSGMDQQATGSPLSSTATFGAVFAFSSDASLKTLADSVEELNLEYDSLLWPDLIVVLDKGVLEYGVEFFSGSGMKGRMNPPIDRDFTIPPWFVRLAILEAGDFTLNHFFYRLMAHVVFYPYRPALLPEAAREGVPNESEIRASYQYNLQRQLVPTPTEWFKENKPRPAALFLVKHRGQQVGYLEYYLWQDGAVVSLLGDPSLSKLLGQVLADPQAQVFRPPGDLRQMTSLLRLSIDKFRAWKPVLEKKTPFTFTEVTPQDIQNL
ncbi:MAG: hypothetical protein JW819_09520 [Candidatus Krumholzibacteriota bacterium]|nr:hypothetical protein [Candidatus Krumholzibacteriota bacterium]